MRASIRDTQALRAVSPAALSAYARAAGWRKTDDYGEHSDVYAAEERPEVIIPRTQRLGDYARVVSRLIDIFARAAETDELALYRDLVTADRDVIRVRAAESGDGAVPVSDGVALMQGAYDMLLAAARSLSNRRPVYHGRPDKKTSEYLRRVRLGQTEQGSFVATLLTPVISPPTQPAFGPDWPPAADPIERKVTKRLSCALKAVRKATERTVSGGDSAFFEAVDNGVSANLCDALVTLVEPFPALDVSLVWARTHPVKPERDVVCFASGDAPILRGAAQSFRAREPQPDARVFGFVQRLQRDQQETDGTVTLRAYVDDGPVKSVTAVLNQSDYERAIQAHSEKAAIIAKGDLEQTGQRWRLLNPSIVEVILNEDDPVESG